MNRFVAIALALFFSTIPATACTFCAGGFANRQTIRERAANAPIVIHGTLTASRFAADGLKGETDLLATTHLKSDAKLGQPATITIPQYLPIVGDTPREYLVFAAVLDGKLDVTNGMMLPASAVDYAKASIALPANDSAKRLAFFFARLESPDATIAADAFLEFAKASDAEIAAAAKSFDVNKVRTWLSDPNTPRDRIGVYALLLGLTGDATDAKRFRDWLARKDERTTANLGGLLAGLTLLDPTSGWPMIEAIVIDPKQPYDRRLSTWNTLRYFRASRPKESSTAILPIAKTLLMQSDFADVVTEDLRQWQCWDLTTDVLMVFDKPTHTAPIIRQAIVRYALSCPGDKAKAFITKLRVIDSKIVERAEANLKLLEAGKR